MSDNDMPAWAAAMEARMTERLQARWAESTIELLARINAVRGHQDDQRAALLARLSAIRDDIKVNFARATEQGHGASEGGHAPPEAQIAFDTRGPER